MHAGQIVLAPIVSEKSYHGERQRHLHLPRPLRRAQDTDPSGDRGALRGQRHPRQRHEGAAQAQAPGADQGAQAGLEEGGRPAQARSDDRGLPGGAALMPVRRFKPTSPGRRFMTVSDFAEVTKSKPEKALTEKLTKKGGRNINGRITTRHQGGGHKRRYRLIDFKRLHDGVSGQGGRDRVRPQPLRPDRAPALRRRAQVLHPGARRSARRVRR